MDSSYLSNTLLYLTNVLLGFFILMLLLRFFLQAVQANFYNPISQAIVKISNIATVPLRNIFPTLKGFDLTVLLVLIGLQMTETGIILSLIGKKPTLEGLILLACSELLKSTVWLFIGSIIIRVVISWIAPYSANPVSELVHALTDPILKQIQNVVPVIGGLDLSPMIALVLLQLALIVPIQWLSTTGIHLL